MGKQGKSSPTVLTVKKRASTSSSCLEEEDDDHHVLTTTPRPITCSYSTESPSKWNTRKSSLASPERTILTSPTNVPKIKPATAWKSALKNEATPRRRRSLGPSSGDPTVDDGKPREQDGYQHAPHGVDKLKKNGGTIVRQSSDSELKRKVKTRVSLTKSTNTTPSRKDGLSLDEYLPSSNNETPHETISPQDDDTVHTDPLSGTKRTEPRRALRGSMRRSSHHVSPSSGAASNTEGSSSPRRLRSRSRSVPRRPSSRERKRAEMERSEAIKFLTATTTTPPSSFIDSMTSSFSSVNSGTFQANDTLQESNLMMDAHHDKTRSHHETKLETRLEEAEERNYHLMKKVEDLENKLVQAQAENEVTYARNRRSKLGSDHRADRDKEIHGLCDSLALSLNHGEPKAEEETHTRNGSTTGSTMSLLEIRLQNELREARAKIASLEKCLSDAQEQNAQLQAEIRCYQSYDSGKYSAVWAAQTEC